MQVKAITQLRQSIAALSARRGAGRQGGEEGIGRGEGEGEGRRREMRGEGVEGRGRERLAETSMTRTKRKMKQATPWNEEGRHGGGRGGRERLREVGARTARLLQRLDDSVTGIAAHKRKEEARGLKSYTRVTARQVQSLKRKVPRALSVASPHLSRLSLDTACSCLSIFVASISLLCTRLWSFCSALSLSFLSSFHSCCRKGGGKRERRRGGMERKTVWGGHVWKRTGGRQSRHCRE
jgi:hypothetical protein